MAPDFCMVRTTAAIKFGLLSKKFKDTFLWFQLVGFPPYMVTITKVIVTLIVATMAILSFSDMCRYNMLVDLSERIFNFKSNSSSFEITFEITKKARFRRGNNVIVLATNYVVCPLKPLRAL